LRHRHAFARPLNDPEVVLNLWAYSGEDECILRLAGKAYFMQGTEDEKLALLRQLAASDFLCATWHKVPESFTVHDMDFGDMKNIAHQSMLSNPQYHEQLFGSLIELLAQSIPEQIRCINGEYQKFQLELPQEPLCVSTVVMEKENGDLVPLVSD